MGQIAEDIECGFQCTHCGICFEDEHGYPVLCQDCFEDDEATPGIPLATLPEL